MADHPRSMGFLDELLLIAVISSLAFAIGKGVGYRDGREEIIQQTIDAGVAVRSDKLGWWLHTPEEIYRREKKRLEQEKQSKLDAQ